MPRIRDARGGRGAVLAIAALLCGAPLLPGAAEAQTRPSTPQLRLPERGFEPLRPEPGDIWADVRAWQERDARRAARRAEEVPARRGGAAPRGRAGVPPQ
ncbi:hypothetical protein [Crenalkalicoccus roseus]|uniref:hypothetical protein n=1 Tax=Crenalkalicoccus roseus TaxID=1485588 RepID=UPI0010810F98|nr:hypothetical protein [Crenalkalicoccus roseus]